MKETHTSWDSAELLNDDETIVEYLKAALEENDPAFFVKAIGNVARAKVRNKSCSLYAAVVVWRS